MQNEILGEIKNGFPDLGKTTKAVEISNSSYETLKR